MTTTNDIIKKYAKEHGEGILGKGVALHNSERVPTGAFPFDLATGGGFPRGRVSVVYGPESSMKTTFALLAIAQYQRLYPDQRAVFIDAENSLEGAWATKLGVNTNELIYAVPEYAEQAIDMTSDFLHSTEAGIIVLDSIAALTASAEIEKSAEDAVVGKGGLNASRFYKKATSAMAHMRRQGHFPTLICINQVRFKIGVLHGDPETQPGGMAFKFASALTVRLYGKDLLDKKVHPSLPYAKEVRGIVKKFKVPIAARTFEVTVPNMNIPEHGIEVGKPDALRTVKAYLESMGAITKLDKGKGYHAFGDDYPTLKALFLRYRQDTAFRESVEGWIIERCKPNDVPEESPVTNGDAS